jgi:hypothetical protein
MRPSSAARRLAFIVIALLLGTVEAQAQSVTLAWDRNPEANIAGYTVYVGVNPGTYSSTHDVNGADNTTFTFTQAIAGTRYYFSVAAYNTDNVTGARSGEVSWKINVGPNLTQPSNRTGAVGLATSLQLAATDDGDPLTYSATGLPGGMTINSSSGLISGTPTTEGTFTVNASVSDGPLNSGRTFTWTIGPRLTVTSLTSNLASPRIVGTPITFTATGAGGLTPYQFKFSVSSNGGSSYTVTRNWSTTATYTWTPTAANANYRVKVDARNAGVTADVAQATANVAFSITSAPPPLTVTNLVTSVPSPQMTGTSITFTPTVTGGTTPYSYKYYVFNGTTWSVLRNWSTTATATWTPTQANPAYNVAVWVRNAGSTADAPEASANRLFTITSTTPTTPLAVTFLATSVTSPQQPGTSITLTPTATGGTGPYSFKYYAFNGTSWSMIRNWSTTAPATWTPTQSGLYNVAVWARNAGSTADTPQSTFNVLYSVRTGSGGPVSVDGLNSSLNGPVPAGTTVTFTPVVSGGTAPYQYKYYAFNGTTWTLIRNWSTVASVTWTPTQPGLYNIATWVRNAGFSGDAPQATWNRLAIVTP